MPFDLDAMFSIEPSFIVVPPRLALHARDPVLDVHNHARFRERCTRVFTLWLAFDYQLAIYRDRDVRLSAEGEAAAREIEAASFRTAGGT